MIILFSYFYPLYSAISSVVLGRDALKTIDSPSGEKNAPPSYPKPKVICFKSVPSVFMVHNSKSPLRSEVNTMRSPLGETVASAS